MKCVKCQGVLRSGDALRCPHCGAVPTTGLENVGVSALGEVEGMGCPRCPPGSRLLERIRLALGEGGVEIERCGDCQGLFFNPGELDFFLENHVSSTVWTDLPRMEQIREEVQKMPSPEGGAGKVYLACPAPGCGVSMNRRNFGGSSGILFASCARHGIWLDGGRLRMLAEWWHAGGKFPHLAEGLEKSRLQAAAAMNAKGFEPHTEGSWGTFLNPLDCAPDGPEFSGWTVLGLLRLIGGIAAGAFLE